MTHTSSLFKKGFPLELNTSVISGGLLELLKYLKKCKGLIWIVKDKDTLFKRAKELSSLSPRKVLIFQAYEHFPFLPLVPSTKISAQRLNTLFHLAESKDIIVLTHARALMERIIPRDILLNNIELALEGEEIDRNGLISWLTEVGYERLPRVQNVGEFSVRGEVLDIFTPNYLRPIRLIFFDELVEEIRVFDPDDQRTVRRLKEAVFIPVKECIFSKDLLEDASSNIVEYAKRMKWSGSMVKDALQALEHQRYTEGTLSLLPFIYINPGSFFDYLSMDSILVFEDSLLIAREMQDTMIKMEETLLNLSQRGHLVMEKSGYVLDFDNLDKKIGEKRRIFLNSTNILGKEDLFLPSLFKKRSQATLNIKGVEHGALTISSGKGLEIFARFIESLDKWLSQGKRVFLFYQNEKSLNRLTGILEHYQRNFHIFSQRDDFWESVLKTNSGLFLVRGFLEEGFLLDDSSVFIPDHSLFAVSISKKSPKRRQKKLAVASISEMAPGDFIVHRDFGVGLYHGLVKMDIAGVSGEYVHLEYHGGDKLYVPVDRLNLLQRYVGIEGREPSLDRLGAKTWQNRKAKVKKNIKEIAHDLVELYAIRKVTKGISFLPPDEMYRQFEMGFPYELTEDQEKAINEIIEDLEADYPMDRLLCGDVGFGKTEVAMRAAFLAVQNGFQVAVLVPTTLLAEQHERTFRTRFENFPVNIAAISRLKSKGLQRQVLDGVRSGKIDILIGTHRILQSDVVFKRLGLVIVDEEHRFGVKQKERLKAITKEVNCLSLTATPIPRTLQLSLLGIRDLSILEDPPKGRQSVRTFLAEFDDAILKEAILREKKRGGQVFFVQNRIKGIFKMADHIKALIKDVRVEVAHGQMEPSKLEEIMIRFVRGEIDCLVCTTIIESGIDIPSANTLIVNRADRLGIADLYQLRGRVGRSHLKAYAYLFVPSLDDLKKEAALRLKAIMETSELGSGMHLALKDLKIRGAGNLLGIAQAGQIAEVGYDLYLDLLKEAIDAFKGKETEKRIEPEVSLGIPTYIPEEFCPSVHERMELYRWFTEVETERDKEMVIEELGDRFGSVPKEVENLLDIMIIKALLRHLNVLRLDGSWKQGMKLTMTFVPEGPKDVDGLLKLVQSDGRFKLLPEGRLFIELKRKDVDANNFTKKVIRLLKELIKLTN